MPAEERQKRAILIRYRECIDQTKALAGMTIEGALREALHKKESGVRIGERWAKRVRRDPHDDRERMAANHVRDGGTYIFGNLVAFTMGRDQAMIVEDVDAKEANIEQFPPPARRQFLESMLFWMATDNHVFIVQQGRLRPAELEEYLTWLLVERTGICSNKLHVILNPDINLKAGIKNEDVRSIRIGGQVHAHAPAAADDETVEHKRERKRVTGGGAELARRVLDLVIGNDRHQVDRILREVPEGVDLSVDVEISFDTTKRKYSRDAMRRIAMATRNLPDQDIDLKTSSGNISGNEIRLSHAVTVPAIGSLLDRDAVLQGMIEAYAKFVRGGRIPPSELPYQEDEA